MKIRLFYLLIISFFIFIAGCSVKNITELDTCKYIMEGLETKDLAWLFLEE